MYISGKFREFAIDYSDAKVITGVDVGGSDKMAMVGHAYMNEGFSALFRKFIENEINDFGISDLFWEEFYAKHLHNLTFFIEEYASDEQLETSMGYLHRIHNIDVDVKYNVKIFDNVVEGNKLLEIASLTKGNLKRVFSDLI